MRESDFWRKCVKPALEGTDASRHENPIGPGTPDVECIHGWIELKQVPKWPGGNGPLRVKHFTPQQRIWLRRRWRANQRAWLLIHVDGDFLLLSGDCAARMLGKVGRDDLIANAIAHWTGHLPKEDLQKCLSQT